MKKTSKKSSIKSRILTIPLVIMFIVIGITSTIAINISKSKLISQMQSDGVNLANEVASQMSKTDKAMSVLNDSIENKISTLGNYLVINSDKINNNFLSDIAKIFQVDEINVVDANGNITYSNLASSIGSTFDSTHISYPVLKGEKNEFMENMRKSRECNDYYKYGYIKRNDGGMIQIGILANKVQSLQSSLTPQALLENLTKDNSIVYANYINKNLKIVASTNKSEIEKNFTDEDGKEAVKEGKVLTNKCVDKISKKEVLEVFVPVNKDGVNTGVINIALSMDNFNKALRDMICLITIFSLIACAITSFILYTIAKGIINPLNNLVFASERISQGDLSKKISVSTDDEIGVLANSFKNMSNSLRETIGNIQEQVFKSEKMSDTLNINSSQMTAATNEVSNSMQEVTKGATKQADDLVEICDHISELTGEIKKIYNKLSLVKESSDETENRANVGAQHIDNLLKSIDDVKLAFQIVIEKVNSLNSSVSQVGSITDVINAISEQTNLLALNAAIEAARAGVAGKGFAVVAEEVRNLAEQSKESTEQIQRLIESISVETKNVILTSNDVNNYVNNQMITVEKTINSFKDMVQSISHITPLIDDTYVSLENTKQSKDKVLNKIEEVTAVSQQTSSSSEEISASSEEMLASSEDVNRLAKDLSDLSKKLNEETNKFKI